ncbi:Multidrug resistance-associated protein 1 [Linnemannia exigua]|uniref:Multidrug resistance-associated protein 1 n=1 Tax=Linnemannia exigua TaxID=604196 RepID=A0AAD4HAZ4_9FUNG|nr:Multidrug resistance-associated protein 1 [Linnemannia exigua]
MVQDNDNGKNRNHDDPPSAYDRANIFSRITFHYIQSVISTGYRRAVTDTDTANMMPHSVRTVSSFERLSRLWSRHLENKKFKSKITARGDDQGGGVGGGGGERVSLFWVLIKMGGWKWIPILCFMFMESILEYAQPLLLDRLLVFISTYSAGDQATMTTTKEQPEPVWVGIVLSLGLTAASIGASVGSAQFIQLATNLGISLQSALVSMVYQKSLRLSSGAQRGGEGSGRGTPDVAVDDDEGTKTETESEKSTTTTTKGTSMGEIQNLMSVDVVAVQYGIIYLPLMISTPFEIIVGLYLLFAQLGLSSLAGLGVVLLMTPVQGWLARMLSVAKGNKMEVMDERIRVLTEMLSSMQVIKLYHWGAFFYRKIEALRTKEIKALKRVGAVMAWMSIMATSIPTLMGLLSFTVYALAGGDNRGRGYLSPQVVFVSLSLFGRLAVPIGRASRVTSMVISLRVAAGRIQRFLLLEEMDWAVVTRPESGGQDQEELGAISIRDGAFSWMPDTNTPNNSRPSSPDNKQDSISTTLQDINFTIPRAGLTAVVGRVGQGKSSLLSALIGEMYKHQGSVQRYDDVVLACCLQQDLEMLAAGDQTEIGERGINLSGGQKQRVALARAAYQDADIYLLDDPLSAVDAHVDQQLWQNVIGPNGLLKDKTRLLVTHGVHHLGQVDQILIIKEGRIFAMGTYDQLLSAGSLASQELSLSVETTGSDERVAAADATAAAVVAASSDQIKEIDDVTEAKDKEGPYSDGQLIQKEEYTHGGAGWKEFLSYAKAAMALFIFSQAVQLGISVWLQKWTERPYENQLAHLGLFLGVYAAMVVAYASSDVLVHYIVFVTSGLRAATLLHNNLLERIIRLPMLFFGSTPVGRIVNRFSTDQDTVDVLLPQALSDFYYYTFTVLGTLVIISMTLPILFGFYVLIQRYYVRTSRAMTHVHAIARSPLFQHFNETLAGVSTIRAMRQEERFVEENAKRTDRAANAYFVTTVTSRWLHFRLECLGATVVLATSLLVVLETVRQKGGDGEGGFSGATLDGKAGLALNYALTATYGITFLVTSVTDLQNRLVNVERVREYCEVPTEAPLRNELVDKDLEEGEWPREGGVVFRNYSTRYRQGMDLVLKKVSFEVLPGEKVGIVGRTGAGKSSLTLALFRIIEAANSHLERASHNNRVDKEKESSKTIDDQLQSVQVEEDGGSVWIDGIDISTMGLEHLRQHLAIIPQDPTLFEGTLRENLDPFHRSTDAELWTALERAHLKDFIATSLPGGLSYEVTSSGSNFSIGQRSLICLARALLQKTKILVLDEATAAVDVETDELIQKTIREEFKDRTILTIAHRIKTVMDSDKILVLEQGRLMEYDSPSELLKRKESLFYRLAEQTGELK